jgi:DNA polymerase bacteriophage-type
VKPLVTDAQLAAFHRIGAKKGEEFGAAPMKKLSLLIRPAFIAPKGKTLVWGDFSNIEARVLPWLAASRGAEEKLDIFRATDRDPVNNPDVYCRTAAALVEMDAKEFWAIYRDDVHELFDWAKDTRQSHGKVPELSLGFGGGLGALQAMARSISVYLSDKVALDVIAKWRASNRWAATFWGVHNKRESYGLWGAICSAVERPGEPQTAGRVAYLFDEDYLGGSLFCALPCTRLLTYPNCRWEWREVEDKKTKKKEEKFQLTYNKGYGRAAMWYGKAAENITQGFAASLLRDCMKRVEFGRGDYVDERPDSYELVMHTHDEVVGEADESEAMASAHYLKKEMEWVPPYAEGLPLAAEITESWMYSKAVKGLHL